MFLRANFGFSRLRFPVTVLFWTFYTNTLVPVTGSQQDAGGQKGNPSSCSDIASSCKKPVKYTGERKNEDGSVCFVYACEFGTQRAHYIYVPPELKADLDTLALPNDGPVAADTEKANRDLIVKVRRAVVSDGSLSTYSSDVKITAQGGKITLSGSVRSEQEKATWESKANEVAGESNVRNKLSVTKAASKQ